MNLWCCNYLKAPTRKADYMKIILQIHAPVYAVATSSPVLFFREMPADLTQKVTASFLQIILYHYLA